MVNDSRASAVERRDSSGLICAAAAAWWMEEVSVGVLAGDAAANSKVIKVPGVDVPGRCFDWMGQRSGKSGGATATGSVFRGPPLTSTPGTPKSQLE